MDNNLTYGVEVEYDKLEQFFDDKNSEIILIKLCEYEKKTKRRWAAFSMLARFYDKHKMYLKMEKVGWEMCKIFSNNYQGYHIRFLAYIEQKKIKNAEIFLESVPEEYKELPQYLDDLIMCFNIQSKNDDILNVLEERYFNIYPKFVLKKKIEIYGKLEKYDEIEECLIKLITDYGDIEAAIGLGILYVSEGRSDEAKNIIELLSENIGNKQVVYLYFTQIIELANKYMEYKNGKIIDKEEIIKNINRINELMEKNNFKLESVISEMNRINDEINDL